ncbi:MAG: hypothetical protein WDO70_01590 [Alphaproteobacteria bacterium]
MNKYAILQPAAQVDSIFDIMAMAMPSFEGLGKYASRKPPPAFLFSPKAVRPAPMPSRRRAPSLSL